MDSPIKILKYALQVTLHAPSNRLIPCLTYRSAHASRWSASHPTGHLSCAPATPATHAPYLPPPRHTQRKDVSSL